MLNVLSIFVFVILFIWRILWFLISSPFIIIWRIIMLPFGGFKLLKNDVEIAKFLIAHKGKKVLFYHYRNYRIVEKHLFPILDRSIIVYFVDRNGFVSTSENETVNRFFQSADLKGGYPYLLKIEDRGYKYHSLKKLVSALKDGKIKPMFAQSTINFMFENE